MFPSSPLHGATLQFVCEFRYYVSQIQVRVQRIDWYLNGMKLSRTKSERLKFHVTEPTDRNGIWNSTLTFNPATPKDSGTYNRPSE